MPRCLKVLRLSQHHNLWQDAVKYHYIYVEFLMCEPSPLNFQIELRYTRPGGKDLRKDRYGPEKFLKKFEKKSRNPVFCLKHSWYFSVFILFENFFYIFSCASPWGSGDGWWSSFDNHLNRFNYWNGPLGPQCPAYIVLHSKEKQAQVWQRFVRTEI